VPQIKVKLFYDARGKEQILPYLFEEKGGIAQFFFSVKNQSDQNSGFMIAPIITCLAQQIGLDGETVDYLDPRGREMLCTDAIELLIDTVKTIMEHINQDSIEKEDPFQVLVVTGNKSSSITTDCIYSQFRVATEGIDAFFYYLDTSLDRKEYHI
jgi:hypothetical protein